MRLIIDCRPAYLLFARPPVMDLGGSAYGSTVIASIVLGYWVVLLFFVLELRLKSRIFLLSPPLNALLLSLRGAILWSFVSFIFATLQRVDHEIKCWTALVFSLR